MLRITAASELAQDYVAPKGAARSKPPLALVDEPQLSTPVAPQAARRGIGAWLIVLGVAVDAAVIALIASALLPRLTDPITHVALAGRWKLLLLYTALNVAMLLNTYRRGRLVPRPSEQALKIATRVALAPMITVALTWWLDGMPRHAWIALVGFTVPAVLLTRLVMFKLVHVVRCKGFDLEDTLIVGAGPVGCDVASALARNPEFGLLPIGFIDRFDERLALPLVGRPEDLEEILIETGSRHVVLAFGSAPEGELVEYVRRCSYMPVQFYTVPRFFELGVPTGHSGYEVDGFALQPLGRPGHHHMMWPLKRAFDIAVSGVLLAMTAPLFAICALAVRLTSSGPIYFRQQRVSVDNIPFDILKFRTMKYVADERKQAELDQRAQAVNLDDDRITSIGKFLRTSHLDELPQLVNVLRGDMSIVGPRPERPYFVDKHTSEIDGYAYRHRVPAGITGWAQVNGFWGDSSLEARVRLDNRYIENWTPVRDLVIGLRTIPTLLGRRR